MLVEEASLGCTVWGGVRDPGPVSQACHEIWFFVSSSSLTSILERSTTRQIHDNLQTLVGTHDGSRHAIPTSDFPSGGFCHQTTAFAWVAYSGTANRACFDFWAGGVAYCVWTFSCRNVFRSPRSVWRVIVAVARPQHLTG